MTQRTITYDDATHQVVPIVAMLKSRAADATPEPLEDARSVGVRSMIEWMRRRQDWPQVIVSGKMAGEVAEMLSRYGQPAAVEAVDSLLNPSSPERDNWAGGVADALDAVLRAQPAASAEPVKGEPDDFELRGMWYGAGGTFHGPNIETGTMPEARLLPFLRSLLRQGAQPAANAEPVATTGRTHTLKTDPAMFQAVLDGAKTFEIRLDDRGFQVGDGLLLRETTQTGAAIKGGAPLEYTGRQCHKVISHVLTGYGLAKDWCCLSFAASVAAQAQTDELKAILAAARHAGWAFERRTDGITRMVPLVTGEAQAQPCAHVFEARPIDGSRSATAPCEAVCIKCGARGEDLTAPAHPVVEQSRSANIADEETAARKGFLNFLVPVGAGDWFYYWQGWQDRAALAKQPSEQDIQALLKNPVVVHANMCRGIIAPITFDMLAHVLGDEAKKEWLAKQSSAQDLEDAKRYRFASKYLVLSGGVTRFGWPIAPTGKREWDKYIDSARATKGE